MDKTRRDTLRLICVPAIALIIVMIILTLAVIVIDAACQEVGQDLNLIQQPEVIEQAVKEPGLTSLGEFKIVHYCPCTKCTPGHNVTATGTTPKEGRTIAVDPDVIPLGSEVIIDGHTYIAEDTGGAIKGKKIDMFVDSHQEAINRGVLKREVYKEEL